MGVGGEAVVFYFLGGCCGRPFDRGSVGEVPVGVGLGEGVGARGLLVSLDDFWNDFWT